MHWSSSFQQLNVQPAQRAKSNSKMDIGERAGPGSAIRVKRIGLDLPYPPAYYVGY